MDKYIFNWNAVLAHCPEYRKYLVDVKSLKDDVEEELILPDIDCLRNISSREDRTEEELEVIKQMSGSGGNPHSGINVYRVAEEATMKDKGPVYTLNPIYKNQPLPVKMNPLQLPPPKCVLDVGSELRFPGKTGWHMSYRIASNPSKDGSVDLVKTKVNEKEDKIQLLKAFYWFNQNENVISDRKGRFKCLTYNKKTRNLYYTRRELKNRAVKGTRKRYKSKVSGILLNIMTLQVATSDVSITLLKSFVDLVEKAVLKDVPDAYIPTFHNPRRSSAVRNAQMRMIKENVSLRHKLLILLLQHKANARLDWLDETVLNNIGRLVGINGFEEQVTNTQKMQKLGFVDYNKYLKNEHKRRVRKVMPSLRTSKSLKALTKAVCGEFYAKILIKLMSIDVHNQRWVDVLRSLHSGRMPKFLYHWISNLLNDYTSGGRVEVAILEALKTLSDINNTNSRERARNLTVLELWVKTCKRFLKQGEYVVMWYTWKDTYSMADRMNIRLRSNKFINSADVQRQHDLFSELTNRDRSILRDYAGVVFREFAIPDKEYGGFTFVQLQTADELVHEGKTMHHCVGGYANRCVNGGSIMFSMRKGDRGYVTVELDGTYMPYNIRQKYTIDDVHVTNETVLELLDNWLEDIRELHKEDSATYDQECENANNTLKAKRQLAKLTELKGKATEDTLTHINNECDRLEQQLTELAMESTQPGIHISELPQGPRSVLGVLRGVCPQTN